MTPGRIVIVGAGQGGLLAAVCLRQEGHQGPIALIGSENHMPYQRPPLSKAYQADSKLQIAVLSWPEDIAITRTDGAVFSFEGHFLSVMKALNNPCIHTQARHFLVGGPRPTRDILENQSYEISPIQR